jgi:hypothetical protein
MPQLLRKPRTRPELADLRTRTRVDVAAVESANSAVCAPMNRWRGKGRAECVACRWTAGWRSAGARGDRVHRAAALRMRRWDRRGIFAVPGLSAAENSPVPGVVGGIARCLGRTSRWSAASSPRWPWGTGAGVALTVLSFTVHLLFSPRLLVVIAILAWIRFRPRRSRR